MLNSLSEPANLQVVSDGINLILKYISTLLQATLSLMSLGLALIY
jgi:hypothetical protein